MMELFRIVRPASILAGIASASLLVCVDMAAAEQGIYEKSPFQIYAKNDRYLKVGTDKILNDNEVVYLDKKSIRKIKKNLYKYTIVADFSREDGYEFDLVVDCKDPSYITSVQQRYYKKRKLFKTEKLGVGEKRRAFLNSTTFPEYESNLAVCSFTRN
jgi:hypothetical protein